jgi:histidine ammonia-lyase
VDSIPTIQHHEDHISNGPGAASGALQLIDLLADVVAIELLCAAQGLDLRLTGDAERSPDEVPENHAGRGSRALHAAVRESVAIWDADRVLHTDLKALGAAVRAGRFGPDAITLAEPWAPSRV